MLLPQPSKAPVVTMASKRPHDISARPPKRRRILPPHGRSRMAAMIGAGPVPTGLGSGCQPRPSPSLNQLSSIGGNLLVTEGESSPQGPKPVLPQEAGRTLVERPHTGSPFVHHKPHNLADRRTRMASPLELSAQSSSCMRRKLFLHTALPIAFPKRSPAT